MKHFCFLISLQAGCTVISIVFLTIASVVFLVNLPHLVANTFLIILLVWLFLIVCVAITSFMAAYLESSGVTDATLFILAVATLYWFCISIIPLASSNDDWLKILCVNERCGESLWLTALSCHKLKQNYPQTCKFMHGDGIFNATSNFSDYNGSNGSNRIYIERKGNDEAKGINRNLSLVEYHNLSVTTQNDGYSFQNFSNLLKTNLPDLDNSHGTKKEYYRNPVNDKTQIQINSKKAGLRLLTMTERNNNLVSILKLRNSNDSWLQKNLSGNIFSNEFTDVVDNSLELSKNDDTLLNKNDVILYYEHGEPVKKSNKFWEKSSIGLTIAFFLLLMNLIFHIYCWFAIYSYWNLLRRSLHDVYQSSDFNESDSFSQSTTKSSWQD